jgi:hypothetical protein
VVPLTWCSPVRLGIVRIPPTPLNRQGPTCALGRVRQPHQGVEVGGGRRPQPAEYRIGFVLSC